MSTGHTPPGPPEPDQSAQAEAQVEHPRRWAIGRRLLIFVVTVAVLEVLLRMVAGNMQIAPYVFHLPDGRCVGLEPNGSVTYTGWLWRVDPVIHEANAYGFRGPERPPTKPEGVFRVALLGDSFVYGQSVASRDAVSAQLEERLVDREPRVEVLNFGVPGYGMTDYVDQYRFLARRWQPDLVVIFIHTSDMTDAFCESVPEDATVENMEMPSYVVRAVFVVLKMGSHLVARFRGVGEREDAIERFDVLMRGFHETVRADGTRLAVVGLGDPLDTPGAMADVLWVHRIPAVVDVDDLLQIERIPGETHYTPAGLGVLAKYVETWLTRESLLPAPAPPDAGP